MLLVFILLLPFAPAKAQKSSDFSGVYIIGSFNKAGVMMNLCNNGVFKLTLDYQLLVKRTGHMIEINEFEFSGEYKVLDSSKLKLIASDFEIELLILDSCNIQIVSSNLEGADKGSYFNRQLAYFDHYDVCSNSVSKFFDAKGL
jgi:hypothetical protein